MKEIFCKRGFKIYNRYLIIELSKYTWAKDYDLEFYELLKISKEL